MCKRQTSIAVCACGANFAACDTVEALCHITSQSSGAHHWLMLETNPFTAGRLLNPPNSNPKDYKEYLLQKYQR
jgi:hypothetical protein